MVNYYADAIDVITRELDYKEKIKIIREFAKQHPKAFVVSAALAGNPKAVELAKKYIQSTDAEDGGQ